MHRKLLEIISVDLNASVQLLIIHSVFVKYLRKKWKYNEAVLKLFIVFKKANDFNLMPLDLLLLYSVLSMFQMLIHPSSGACD